MTGSAADPPDALPDAPADVRALTRDLVATPSHEDETAAGDHLESWLREETDAAVARDDHGNVLAARSPDGDAMAPPADTETPTLALVGHHDVVPPDDSQVVDDGGDTGTEYVVAERDGRLYGRGSADMKGSLAALVVAFRDATLPDGGPRLVFASFVGEEVGGEGCRAAIEDGFAPEWAVVGEGSTGYSADGVTDVAVAHKGRRASTLVAHGRAAHASEPERGDNAVYHATDAVDIVRDLDAPTATVLGHDLASSVAVTGIEGGDAWNVIPERCEVTVDERTVPGDRADIGRAAGDEHVDWTVDQDLPPMACRDGAFADAALAAARAAHGHPDDPLGRDADGVVAPEPAPEHVVKPHATDAGWLADRAGTDPVVCGAAEPGEAHTADESVSLAVLDRCYRVYRLLAETFGGGTSGGD
ncbi:M20 family metallopeptidase [Haloglomus litoreum]|uniref:M20 family metallopeptidase n=1 Tax=Haloglomus litoreum TaxID=3034026 RepID=UPI0023E8082C|nr:M20/M25/M40 family metallo-hydrolase [Haloglomus sp. DT116]